MCNSSRGLGTDFLDMTPKVQIKEENTDQIFSKLKKNFFLPQHFEENEKTI